MRWQDRNKGLVRAVAAAVLIVVVLLDAFSAMILPRRVKHVYLARLFYRSTWASGGPRRG